jgi:CRISPR-associated protein Cpf1
MVEHQGYKISFQSVADSFMTIWSMNGKLYLFQIYNKDFSTFSQGKPNLHTLYWKMLFAEEKSERRCLQTEWRSRDILSKNVNCRQKTETYIKAKEILKNKKPDNPKATSRFEYRHCQINATPLISSSSTFP